MKLVNSKQFFNELMFKNKKKKENKNIIRYIKLNLSSFKDLRSDESSVNNDINQNSKITKEFKNSELKTNFYIPNFNFEIINNSNKINIEERKIEKIIDNLKNGIIQLNERHFIINASKLLKNNINFTNKVHIFEKKNIKNITIYPIEINKNKLKKKYNLIKSNKNFEKSKNKFQNNKTTNSFSIINNSNISDIKKKKNNDYCNSNTISTKSTITKIVGIVKIKKNYINKPIKTKFK